MIKYGSVCSGVEAASLAWEPLGWIPAWFSEIDPVASGVLAYHWPDVPNLGDMLELDAEQCADIDVLVGGLPCQSFSIAGLRKGLQDDRGNLTLSFVRLAEAIDAVRSRRGQPPLIIVWENVPGVFSDRGNAFGCFLGAMAGEDEPLVPAGERWTNAGYVLGPSRTIAFRVLNAQYFGVPQRRRRVFVIASARKGFDPGEVLLITPSLRGDTQEGEEAQKETPGDVVPSLVASGRGVARTGESRWQDPVIPVAGALRGGNGGGSKSFVLAETAATVRAADGHHSHSSPRGDGSDNLVCTVQNTGQGYWKESDVGETLRCSGKGGENRNANLAVLGGVVSMSENQRAEIRTSDVVPSLSAGGGKPGSGFPCIAFSSRDSGGDAAEEIAPTPRAAGHDKSHPNAGAPPAVAFNARQDPSISGDKSNSLDTQGNSQGVAYQCPDHPCLATNLRVRRLLPVETERLQGIPDRHTARTADKELADGPRYNLVGNSMTVPVMRWIGRRIQAVIQRLGNAA